MNRQFMNEEFSRYKNYEIFLLIGNIAINTIFIVINNLIIINTNTNTNINYVDYVYHILICLAASALYLSALNILYFRLAYRLFNNQYKDAIQFYLKYKKFIFSFILSNLLTYMLIYILYVITYVDIYQYHINNSLLFLTMFVFLTIALNCELVFNMVMLQNLSGIVIITDLNMDIEDIQVTTVYNSI